METIVGRRLLDAPFRPGSLCLQGRGRALQAAAVALHPAGRGRVVWGYNITLLTIHLKLLVNPFVENAHMPKILVARINPALTSLDHLLNILVAFLRETLKIHGRAMHNCLANLVHVHGTLAPIRTVLRELRPVNRITSMTRPAILG